MSEKTVTVGTSDVREGSTPTVQYTNFQAVTKVSSEFLISDSEKLINQLGHRPSYGPDYVHKRLSVQSGNADDEDYDRHRSLSFASGVSERSNSFTKHEEKGGLEIWWVNSPIWRRMIPLMCITMLSLSIIHAGFAVYCFTAEDNNGKDVDVCKTQGCKDIADWINEGLNKTVDPCDNFYDFVCGKYSNPREDPDLVPDTIDFTFTKLQFNDQGVLAEALNPMKGIREDTLVAFYKSCLDTRRRKSTELAIMAKIINATMPWLFTDPSLPDKPGRNGKAEGGKRVAATTGHLGFFGYQLLEYPNVALLPPRDWILEYSYTFPSGFANFTKELTKTFRAVWAKLEVKIGKPLLEVSKAVNLTAKILLLMSSIKFDHRESNTTGTEAVRRANLLLGAILGDKWVLSVIEVTTKKFTTGDLENVINQVFNNFPKEDVGPALVSFWIFCALEKYADELTKPSRLALNLQNLFPHKSSEFKAQDTSIERFCFESLSEHLNGHTYNRFVRYLETPHILTSKMGQAFREIRRAMRFIYFSEQLPDSLSPREALIMTAFMNPRNNITLRYPFPHDTNTRRFFNELESFYSTLKLGPDFLINLRDATRSEHNGQLNSWRQKRTDFKRRQSFELERFFSEIDNAAEYENNVYPPVVLFDRPLFLNDMRVFDQAGAVLYLTRNFLSLWRKNLENPSPLLNILQGPIFGNFERSRYLTNEVPGFCQIRKRRSSRQQFFDMPLSRDALAFIISIQLLRNSVQFASLTYKVNGSVAEQVEPLFYANRTFNYVEVFKDGDKFPKYKFLNKSDYVPQQKGRFKFQFKRAPNGLENFNEEQLFFIAAIRHHCYNLRAGDPRSRHYISEVNGVLEQVEEFAEVWNCPLGSPMNPTNKCL